MADFQTEAELSVTVSDAELRQARQQIEGELSDVDVGVSSAMADGGALLGGGGGGDGRGATSRARQRRGFIPRTLGNIHEELDTLVDLADDRNRILRDIADCVCGDNVGGGGEGGPAPTGGGGGGPFSEIASILTGLAGGAAVGILGTLTAQEALGQADPTGQPERQSEADRDAVPERPAEPEQPIVEPTITPEIREPIDQRGAPDGERATFTPEPELTPEDVFNLETASRLAAGTGFTAEALLRQAQRSGVTGEPPGGGGGGGDVPIEIEDPRDVDDPRTRPETGDEPVDIPIEDLAQIEPQVAPSITVPEPTPTPGRDEQPARDVPPVDVAVPEPVVEPPPAPDVAVPEPVVEPPPAPDVAVPEAPPTPERPPLRSDVLLEAPGGDAPAVAPSPAPDTSAGRGLTGRREAPSVERFQEQVNPLEVGQEVAGRIGGGAVEFAQERPIEAGVLAGGAALTLAGGVGAPALAGAAGRAAPSFATTAPAAAAGAGARREPTGGRDRRDAPDRDQSRPVNIDVTIPVDVDAAARSVRDAVDRELAGIEDRIQRELERAISGGGGRR